MSVDTSKPCIKYLRGRTTTPSSGRTTTPTFSMIPAEVLFDVRLRHEDVHGYAVMAYFRDGPTVNTGQRRLAEATGVDRRTMRRIIGRLLEFGYLEVAQKGKWRAKYRLISPLFSKEFSGKPSIGAESGDLDACLVTPKPPIKICPECHKKRRGLMSLGWCRSCNSVKKMEKISRRVVKEELGQQKTA